MHELVIRGGTVVDGSGRPARRADVAIDHGSIVDVGLGVTLGHRELDAGGLLVTPGWVDIHSHYDGQALWDPILETSAAHGVTTVVMGNCGVGFAPVHFEDRAWTIALMEGVEDIPAAVLEQGLGWGWETFPEYLDALDTAPHAIDVATQVPHAALRVFVMGQRGIDHAEVPTDSEIALMGRLAAQAVEAGALGFSTSRSRNHAASDGPISLARCRRCCRPFRVPAPAFSGCAPHGVEGATEWGCRRRRAGDPGGQGARLVSRWPTTAGIQHHQ